MEFRERANIITTKLAECGSVSVQEMSEALGVSMVTIRKDFEALEKQGRLLRTFGGAVPAIRSTGSARRMQAAQIIADNVVREISEGDSIIINAGNTTLLTARNLLRFKRLKVLTNSISIAKELSRHEEFQLILLGGAMNADAIFTHGKEAIRQLEQYKAKKLILSVSGISCKRGLTTVHMEAADLMEKMIERAKEVIAVADDSKIGFESFYHVSDARAVTKLFTNRSEDESKNAVLDELEHMGIQVERC
ncbi:MAG TPA: DeoR/GlpR family DNA-binding transcription regulator [Eubacteriales bacterium]|nr:DeoR/GlpR family DNA-binding transcription regulator [Eubacteriales bacterium]